MEIMVKKRIELRLYDTSAADRRILEWIESLPKDEKGRKRLREHVVGALLRGIGEVSATGRRTTPPKRREVANVEKRVSATSNNSKRQYNTPVADHKPLPMPSMDALGLDS